MMSVTQAVHRGVQMRAGSAAVVGENGERTWRQWRDDIASLAAGLRAQGMRAGDRAAIIAHNSVGYLDAIFAVAWAGGVVVPVNTRLSVAEIAYILGHADSNFVFVDAALKESSLAAIAEAGITATVVGIHAGEAELDIPTLVSHHEPCEDAARSGDDLSGIFYTGGTTGRSKGVMLSQANHHVHSLAMWAGRSADPADLRYLHAAPMFHIADAEFIYGVTYMGGTHFTIPGFEAGAFLDAVARHKITDVVLVPTMIQMLLDHPALATTDTTSLNRLWYGGSPLAEQTILRLLNALPHVSPIQLYGQTEAGPIITILESADHNPAPEHITRRRAAGRPVAGCHVCIVDENGAHLANGEVGEIIARSGSVMTGYWQDKAQTAAALQDGWLHTGDAGYMDEDGYVYVTDRFKDMIITGGENVFSIEVEQFIYAFPGVAQCAVIGVSDVQWGERIHAVIVPQPGKSIDTEALTDALRKDLAGFKIPRSYDIRSAPLPVSGAGKILKRELRREAEEGQ